MFTALASRNRPSLIHGFQNFSSYRINRWHFRSDRREFEAIWRYNKPNHIFQSTQNSVAKFGGVGKLFNPRRTAIASPSPSWPYLFASDRKRYVLNRPLERRIESMSRARLLDEKSLGNIFLWFGPERLFNDPHIVTTPPKPTLAQPSRAFWFYSNFL